MKSFNRVILIGNLVHDPSLSSRDGETARCSFSIALNQPRKTASGAWTDEVHYFDITAFGKTAENVSGHKRKGDPVLIEGRLDQSRWETDSGQKRQRVGVLAQSVTFLPRGSGSASPRPHVPASEVPDSVGQVFPEAEPVGEGEIQF